MNCEEAINYIHSTGWNRGTPGLTRISALLEALGNPQDGLPYIHVAGTNGKGSTCAMLDSVLRAEGYCVGLFTSPYIRQFRERIRVDGECIGEDELASFVTDEKLHAELFFKFSDRLAYGRLGDIKLLCGLRKIAGLCSCNEDAQVIV